MLEKSNRPAPNSHANRDLIFPLRHPDKFKLHNFCEIQNNEKKMYRLKKK